MLRIGLTGGLASGKSFVGHALRDLGCRLIEADELGHQVLLPGAEAYQPVVEAFGREILDPEGKIDRQKLGHRVFDKPEELKLLSSFVHPAVTSRQERIIAEILKNEPHAIVVVEAAILVETGSYKKFDRLIVVVCKREQQMERAMKRGTYTREEIMARLDRQLPLEEKLRVADYMIDTSGTKENTLEQVRAMYASLRSLPA